MATFFIVTGAKSIFKRLAFQELKQQEMLILHSRYRGIVVIQVRPDGGGGVEEVDRTHLNKMPSVQHSVETS